MESQVGADIEDRVAGFDEPPKHAGQLGLVGYARQGRIDEQPERMRVQGTEVDVERRVTVNVHGNRVHAAREPARQPVTAAHTLMYSASDESAQDPAFQGRIHRP